MMRRKPLTKRVVNIKQMETFLGGNGDACDICGSSHATIGCPNGKQICQDCFDAGYDGNHFHEDKDFHHYLGV